MRYIYKMHQLIDCSRHLYHIARSDYVLIYKTAQDEISPAGNIDYDSKLRVIFFLFEKIF